MSDGRRPLAIQGSPARVLQVAVGPRYAAPLLDYLAPEDGVEAWVGARVSVPLGKTRRTGIVLQRRDHSRLPADRLRPVSAVLDEAPLWDSVTLELLLWAADYYCHPLGQVLAYALPQLLRQGRKFSDSIEADAPPDTDALSQTPLALSAEQALAVKAMAAAEGFVCHLLDGVTASGKTEVYLHLLEHQLAAGRQCLLLAPEIGLTPQLADRLNARFRVKAAVLHSGLTGSERLRAWADARSGRARLVVGTRSAIFTPCPWLGLIVVDEEHDPSYKQQEGFRYQARDLAVMRASRAGIPVLLGSATPSLESLLNVRKNRYTRHRLATKVTGGPPPVARLIDLNRHPPEHGLSRPLARAMSEQLQSGAQVLLYLNRRGFAPVLMCRNCRKAEECRHCDARMVFYRERNRLLCHHCGAMLRPPSRCADCGTPLEAIGRGTERLEEEISARFPEYPAVRMDRDNVRGRRRLEDILSGIHERHYRILLGTQMLTKGHDFPSLALVAVIDADQGLFSQEFRGPERLAQTLVQVAGRAGRRSAPGLLVLQTRMPEHPLLRQLLSEGYAGFADTALELRQRSGWPPFAHLAVLRAKAPQASSVGEFLEQAKACLPPEQAGDSAVQLLGPAPALMERRRDRRHAHLLARATSRARLQAFLGAWIPRVRELPRRRRVTWSLDVDPVEIG